MLHQEFTATIEARVQEEVAKFLALKSVLVRLQGSPSPTVRDRADSLYAQQVVLERELQDTLKRIENIKKGAYTISDITAIGSFSSALRKHIKQVKDLESRAPIQAPLFPPLALLIGAGALVGVVAWQVRRRGR